MSILVLAAAGLLGWLAGRQLPGLQGVAAGWTVAVTVIWAAFCGSKAVRDLIRTRANTGWEILPGIWFLLVIGIALPATICAWIQGMAGWVGLPLGLGVASTLFLLVVFAAVRIVGVLAPNQFYAPGKQRTWEDWRTVREAWLLVLFLGILPLTVVE